MGEDKVTIRVLWARRPPDVLLQGQIWMETNTCHTLPHTTMTRRSQRAETIASLESEGPANTTCATYAIDSALPLAVPCSGSSRLSLVATVTLQALRSLIAEHTGVEPPAPPPRPRVACLGRVDLKDSSLLLEALPELSSTEGIYADLPTTMEEYGQRCVHKGGVRCGGASGRQPLTLVLNGIVLDGLPENATHPHFVVATQLGNTVCKAPPHHAPTLQTPGLQVGPHPLPHTAAMRRIVG